MERFYSSCAAGLEGPASALAARGVRGYEAERLLGGALLYRAAEDRPNLAVFQNTYVVIASYAGGESPERAAARAAGDKAALSRADQLVRKYGFQTFRVMFSDCNKLVSASAAVRASIERAVRCATPDRLTPQTELLFLRRSEGLTLFMLRLTRRNGTEKTLAKGELSPGIAACMAEMCHPTPDGVFWDPFAGHGALGLARLRLAPVKTVLLSDIDPQMAAAMRAREEFAEADNVRVFVANALAHSPMIAPGSVSELATDPPWGAYSPLPEPAERFYSKMLTQFARALAVGGRMTLLTADKAAFEAALPPFAQALRFEKRVDMLVNGKKAALFAAERI